MRLIYLTLLLFLHPYTVGKCSSPVRENFIRDIRWRKDVLGSKKKVTLVQFLKWNILPFIPWAMAQKRIWKNLITTSHCQNVICNTRARSSCCAEKKLPPNFHFVQFPLSFLQSCKKDAKRNSFDLLLRNSLSINIRKSWTFDQTKNVTKIQFSRGKRKILWHILSEIFHF